MGDHHQQLLEIYGCTWKNRFWDSAPTAPVLGSFPLIPAVLAAGQGKEIPGYPSQQMREVEQ